MTQSSGVTTAVPIRGAREAGEEESTFSVGSWRLLRQVGEGTLTRVFLARPADAPADRPSSYAVKLLRPQWHDEPLAVALLRREAFVGLSVSHRHLVSILAAHVHQPPLYVVMPYLHGATLDRHLTRRGRLAPAVALWIARQTAEALSALHAEGWLHGDVKPHNVLIAPDGHATLLDLGFARRIDAPGGRPAGTGSGDRPVLGTLNYLAPEMIVPAMPCDQRSDLYSLGAMLYEMLSGRLPFYGRDPAELAHSHRQTTPPDLAELVTDLSPAVVDLVARLLAKQPLRRPHSAREVADLLMRAEIEAFAQRTPAPCA